jgi:hypothetical protein
MTTAPDKKKWAIRSLVTAAITYFNSTHDEHEHLDMSDADDIKMVEDTLRTAIDAVSKDNTCWGRMRGGMLYDVYLDMRADEKTITETDLTRPGLTIGMFSSNAEFHEHCMRVSEGRNKGVGQEADVYKLCTGCGKTLPRNKFRKQGGTKCNACQCAARRANRKEDDDAGE